ncbi:MAG: VOC family protein [Chloroflexota bacterium]|nr:VOC family protein [Chloroflexota bacterium]
MALIAGIHAVVITVRDLEASASCYCAALGWEAVAETDLPATVVERLWGGCSAARLRVLTAAGAESGRVHLVQFAGSAPASIGFPDADAYGLFAIDVYVRDLDVARQRCDDAGAVWVGGPATWHLGEPPNQVTVQQGFVHFPDDVNLTLVVPARPRRTLAWERDPAAAATELTSVVVCAEDVEASKAFWGTLGLGLVEQYDAEFAQPAMARMVGRPETFAQRMAFLVGSATARLEVTGRPRRFSDAAWRSLDNRPHQRPGRSLGQGAWVVVTDRLEEAIRVALARGGRLLTPPFAVDGEVYCGRRVAVVETPEQTLLEIWGPLPAASAELLLGR